MPYVIPADSHAVGDTGHTVDHNSIADVLAGMGMKYNVLNTAWSGGADPTRANDSTDAFIACAAGAAAAGAPMIVPGGDYEVSGNVPVVTGQIVQGFGENSTIINQTDTAVDTFSGLDQRYITIRDIQLNGPGSGSGRGIALLHSSQAVAGINLENVIAQNFGGDGIHLETPITSVLTKVRSQSNGGHGVFANNGTSLSMKAVYANANAGNGYELDAMNYMQLDACAADSNTIGYSVNGSSAMVLNACGSEGCVDGFKVLGASANIVLQGCKVLAQTGIAIWITGSSVFCFLLAPREASPGVGATASFQVDSGSSAVVIDPQNTTATNYAAGSVCLFQPTNLEIHSSGSATARVSRGATGATSRYVSQTGNSDRWSSGLEADSTDNWHLKDLGHTLDAIVAAYQAGQPNLGFLTGSGSPSYGGGTGVLFVANATTAPVSSPAGGGILFVSGGALKYMGSSGTVTTVASA